MGPIQVPCKHIDLELLINCLLGPGRGGVRIFSPRSVIIAVLCFWVIVINCCAFS